MRHVHLKRCLLDLLVTLVPQRQTLDLRLQALIHSNFYPGHEKGNAHSSPNWVAVRQILCGYTTLKIQHEPCVTSQLISESG